MTFGEISWLLFGAVLAGPATYAMLLALTLVVRLLRPRSSLAAALCTAAPERARDVATHSRFERPANGREHVGKLTLPKIRMIDKPGRVVPNIERMVVARIEALEQAALHPEHGARARVTAQDLIASVRVIEEREHSIAEIDGGRLMTLGAAPDGSHGA